MANLKTVGVELIDANPWRGLDTYPWIEKKLESLQKSIEQVGMWEGIIVRQNGKRYELAFGHHRLEAAKRTGLTAIDVIVRDLTDQQMLEFMGRENGEDYSTEFLIMLNSWEGAVQFMEKDLFPNPQPLDIAMLLGWTVEYDRSDREGEKTHRMTPVAKACANAHALIEGGYIARDDLDGLAVHAADQLLSRTRARMEQIEKVGQATKRPAKEVEQTKRTVAKAAKAVAKDVKAGEIRTKDIRGAVDTQSYKVAQTSKVKQTPLFSVFGEALAKQIGNMIRTDNANEKLQHVESAIEQITMQEDLETVERLQTELRLLGQRADKWVTRITPNKVVKLDVLEGGDK